MVTLSKSIKLEQTEGVNLLKSADFNENPLMCGRDSSDFGTGEVWKRKCARYDSAALPNYDV